MGYLFQTCVYLSVAWAPEGRKFTFEVYERLGKSDISLKRAFYKNVLNRQKSLYNLMHQEPIGIIGSWSFTFSTGNVWRFGERCRKLQSRPVSLRGLASLKLFLFALAQKSVHRMSGTSKRNKIFVYLSEGLSIINADFAGGHPTTVFGKIYVRRSKYCLEFSIRTAKNFHRTTPCTIFEAYLINSLRFSEV